MKKCFALFVVFLCYPSVVIANKGDGLEQSLNMPKVRAEAEQGNAVAQNLVGIVYIDKKEYALGLEWVNRSANQHYPPAETFLGDTYSHGDYVQKDNVQAYKWYSLAAAEKNQKYTEVETDAAHKRDALAKRMTEDEISQALAMTQSDNENPSRKDTP